MRIEETCKCGAKIEVSSSSSLTASRTVSADERYAIEKRLDIFRRRHKGCMAAGPVHNEPKGSA